MYSSAFENTTAEMGLTQSRNIDDEKGFSARPSSKDQGHDEGDVNQFAVLMTSLVTGECDLRAVSFSKLIQSYACSQREVRRLTAKLELANQRQRRLPASDAVTDSTTTYTAEEAAQEENKPKTDNQYIDVSQVSETADDLETSRRTEEQRVLKEQLDVRDRELTMKARELEAKTIQVEELRGQLAQIKKEGEEKIKALGAELGSANYDRVGDVAGIERIADALHQAQARLNDSKNEVAALQSKLNQVESRNEKVARTAEVEALTLQVDELHQELKRVKGASDEKIEALEEALCQARLTMNEKLVNEARLFSNSDPNGDLARIKTLAEALHQTQATVNHYHEKSRHLKAKLHKAKSSLQEKDAKIEKFEAEIELLCSDSASSSEEGTSAHEKPEDFEQLFHEKRAECKELHALLVQLKHELREHNGQVAKFTTELHSREPKQYVMESSCSKQEAETMTTKEPPQSSQLQHDYDQSLTRVTELSIELAECRAKLEELNGELKRGDTRRNRTGIDISSLVTPRRFKKPSCSSVGSTIPAPWEWDPTCDTDATQNDAGERRRLPLTLLLGKNDKSIFQFPHSRVDL